ncbi:MAG: hypothetical protein MUF08_07600 [Burkholderiaceae bacterium]|nr:hypothetical protein [Burkholderiaceae bacterium]
MVRICVGLEPVEDTLWDIDQALATASIWITQPAPPARAAGRPAGGVPCGPLRSRPL